MTLERAPPMERKPPSHVAWFEGLQGFNTGNAS
jgi:hypothetical protein